MDTAWLSQPATLPPARFRRRQAEIGQGSCQPRGQRDHEFLGVLAAAVDSGFSASDLASLVLTFHGVNTATAPQWTVPVMSTSTATTSTRGATTAPSSPDQSQDQQVVDTFLGVGPQTDTMTGRPLPSPDQVTVAVENGSGTANQAATGDVAPAAGASATTTPAAASGSADADR